jgi:predicted phosphodiesterase
MRYLILADIHANIDALEAINESFDRVLFLGDLVDYGPAPDEAVQWIRKAEAIGVRGNHDFAMARGADQGWLLLGHTHRPFVRKTGSLTIVNPGSLGMPVDGDPRACYAIWHEGGVELKRVGYDVGRAVERLRPSGLSEEVVIGMSSVLRYAMRCAPSSEENIAPVKSHNAEGSRAPI